MNNRQVVCNEGLKSLSLILDQLNDRSGITPKDALFDGQIELSLDHII